MNNEAIGIFDSGLGGLTAVREILEILPNENIVYFGDTGRVPYGSKSNETINKYAMQDARFLKSQGVKMIVAACGTVSSVAPVPGLRNTSLPSQKNEPLMFSKPIFFVGETLSMIAIL